MSVLKCPHCGKYYFDSSSATCPHCGKDVRNPPLPDIFNNIFGGKFC